MNLLALTQHNGLRIAELGFALSALAGALLALGSAAPLPGRSGRALAGLALAAGSVLLIVAVHWGHFH